MLLLQQLVMLVVVVVLVVLVVLVMLDEMLLALQLHLLLEGVIKVWTVIAVFLFKIAEVHVS